MATRLELFTQKVNALPTELQSCLFETCRIDNYQTEAAF